MPGGLEATWLMTKKKKQKNNWDTTVSEAVASKQPESPTSIDRASPRQSTTGPIGVTGEERGGAGGGA